MNETALMANSCNKHCNRAICWPARAMHAWPNEIRRVETTPSATTPLQEYALTCKKALACVSTYTGLAPAHTSVVMTAFFIKCGGSLMVRIYQQFAYRESSGL